MTATDRGTLERARNQQTQPVISSLAGYIGKCWAAAKQAKQPIEQQMLKNLRQRNGIYEARQAGRDTTNGWVRGLRPVNGDQVPCGRGLDQ